MEIHRQYNLETIIQHTYNRLEENANPELIDKDWLNYFISMAQDADDEYLKEVWANILSKESSESRSFSKYTLNVLNVMSVDDCKLFNKFCCSVIRTENHAILIKIKSELPFNDTYKFDYNDFLRLSDLGLINNSEQSYISMPSNKSIKLLFPNGTHYTLTNKSDNLFNLKFYLLTLAGKELFKIQEIIQNNEYQKSLVDFLSENNLVLKEFHPQIIEEQKRRSEKFKEQSEKNTEKLETNPHI
jgi:hypothetical protein